VQNPGSWKIPVCLVSHLLSVTIFGNVNFIVLGKGQSDERANLGVDCIILKRILLRRDGTEWAGFMWHRITTINCTYLH